MTSSQKSIAGVNPDNEEDVLVEGTIFAYNTVAIPFREPAKTTMADLIPRFKSNVQKSFSSEASKYRPDVSKTMFYHPGSRSHSPTMPNNLGAVQSVDALHASSKDVTSIKPGFHLAAPSTTLGDLSPRAKPLFILPPNSPSVFGRETSTLFSPANIIFALYQEEKKKSRSALEYHNKRYKELDTQRETSEKAEKEATRRLLTAEHKLVTSESQRMEAENQSRKRQEDLDSILANMNKSIQDAIEPLRGEITSLREENISLQGEITSLREENAEQRRIMDVMEGAISINRNNSELAIATLYPPLDENHLNNIKARNLIGCVQDRLAVELCLPHENRPGGARAAFWAAVRESEGLSPVEKLRRLMTGGSREQLSRYAELLQEDVLTLLTDPRSEVIARGNRLAHERFARDWYLSCVNAQWAQTRVAL